tara:strand:- start:322 stop:930 length:609 start_codon:yes stop_codon:yes gene_type:complete
MERMATIMLGYDKTQRRLLECRYEERLLEPGGEKFQRTGMSERGKQIQRQKGHGGGRSPYFEDLLAQLSQALAREKLLDGMKREMKNNLELKERVASVVMMMPGHILNLDTVKRDDRGLLIAYIGQKPTCGQVFGLWDVVCNVHHLSQRGGRKTELESSPEGCANMEYRSREEGYECEISVGYTKEDSDRIVIVRYGVCIRS